MNTFETQTGFSIELIEYVLLIQSEAVYKPFTEHDQNFLTDMYNIFNNDVSFEDFFWNFFFCSLR